MHWKEYVKLWSEGGHSLIRSECPFSIKWGKYEYEE